MDTIISLNLNQYYCQSSMVEINIFIRLRSIMILLLALDIFLKLKREGDGGISAILIIAWVNY